MKYIVVYLHSSNEDIIKDYLSRLGIKVCNMFRDRDDIPNNTYHNSNIVYNIDDINNMFENNSYIILHRKYNNISYYEGISKYDYDNSEILFLTPDQFNLLSLNKDDCVIWIDDTRDTRYRNYINNQYDYDFVKEENYEGRDMINCINKITERDYIYFSNEDPYKIFAIIYSIIKYPDLIKIFQDF